MADAPLRGGPLWLRAASTVIRRLAAGRFRAIKWNAGRGIDRFWMRLPADLGDTPVKSLLTPLAGDAERHGDWPHVLWTRGDLAA